MFCVVVSGRLRWLQQGGFIELLNYSNGIICEIIVVCLFLEVVSCGNGYIFVYYLGDNDVCMMLYCSIEFWLQVRNFCWMCGFDFLICLQYFCWFYFVGFMMVLKFVFGVIFLYCCDSIELCICCGLYVYGWWMGLFCIVVFILMNYCKDFLMCFVFILFVFFLFVVGVLFVIVVYVVEGDDCFVLCLGVMNIDLDNMFRGKINVVGQDIGFFEDFKLGGKEWELCIDGMFCISNCQCLLFNYFKYDKDCCEIFGQDIFFGDVNVLFGSFVKGELKYQVVSLVYDYLVVDIDMFDFGLQLGVEYVKVSIKVYVDLGIVYEGQFFNEKIDGVVLVVGV